MEYKGDQVIKITYPHLKLEKMAVVTLIQIFPNLWPQGTHGVDNPSNSFLLL